MQKNHCTRFVFLGYCWGSPFVSILFRMLCSVVQFTPSIQLFRVQKPPLQFFFCPTDAKMCHWLKLKMMMKTQKRFNLSITSATSSKKLHIFFNREIELESFFSNKKCHMNGNLQIQKVHKICAWCPRRLDSECRFYSPLIKIYAWYGI